MNNVRIIARLDIKGPNLIKGVHLEGLRVVGDPDAFAYRYYLEGIDEIIFMDAVASLMGRNGLLPIIRKTASRIFIPLTVGGGIRSVDDVREVLRNGADKVAVNTAVVKRPSLISEISQRFGSQCMVLQIDAKRTPNGSWEAYTDMGREHSGLDAVEWAREGVSLGAGEVLLTSVDMEGTFKGLDLELIQKVTESVTVPVIAGGGIGTTAHFIKAVIESKANAVTLAGALHYNRLTISEVRSAAMRDGIPVRSFLTKERPESLQRGTP
jgi:cyclase